MFKSRNVYIFLAIISFSVIFTPLLSVFFTQDGIDKLAITKKLEKSIREKENILDSITNKVYNDINFVSTPDFETFYESYNRQFVKEKGIYVLVFVKNQLTLWNSNRITFDEFQLKSLKNGFIYAKNAWFLARSKKIQNTQIVVLQIVKDKYKFSNDYLTSAFFRDFDFLPSSTNIVVNTTGYDIKSNNEKYLFSLDFSNFKEKNTLLNEWMLTSLYFVFLIIFIFSINKIIFNDKFKASLKWKNIIFIVFLVIIRGSIFLLKTPVWLHDLSIFSPLYYATSDLLPSLGDLILHIFFGLVIAYLFYKQIQLRRLLNINNKLKILISSLFIFLIIFFFNAILEVLYGLIINSSIFFNVKNIFDLDILSYIGFVAFGLIFLLYFLVADRLFSWAYQLMSSFVVILLISIPVFLIVCLISGFDNVELLATIYVFIFLLKYYKSKQNRDFNISAIFAFILFFSALSTLILLKFNTIKEIEHRKSLAVKLSNERDPVAESLFNDIEKEIYEDTLLIKLTSKLPYDELAISERIKTFFSGYFSKYDIQITTCQPSQMLLIQPYAVKTDCKYYFDNIINRNGIPTFSDNIYFLKNETGRNSYIAALNFNKNYRYGLIPLDVFIELDAKYITKELGYPELLLNKEMKINKDLLNYSYAKYSNNELIYQYGNYFYNILYKSNKIDSLDFSIYNENDYSHLIYRYSKNNLMILSKKNENLLEKFAPFSYFFLFFLLIVSIFLLSIQSLIKLREFHLSFKAKIQSSMILVVIFSFIFIGAGTIYFITNLYNNKNLNTIFEKTHSVLIETENRLASEKYLNTDMKYYLNNILVGFSNVFFTDINLFDLNGNLLASSRSKIFEEGLIAKKMNPEAFINITKKQTTLFYTRERIGKLSYISVYVPFRNNQNKIIAYLNIPYFAKQSELKKEISSFVISFINIYVLLTAITIIIALFITNQLSKPLQIIKSNIAKVRLGKQNQKIKWRTDDEIGDLVSEYNRMIDELAKSADLLAKSEREGAWREMAKQIAHEIKNPLTPMKLSVQMLEKSWKDKAPNWDDRLSRFTETIVEQIDALSNIATAFSDFAKMPKSEMEAIEISSFIVAVTDLYRDFDDLNISFTTKCNTDCLVWADKKQLLRVFNNLIRNSIQAVESKACEININITDKEKFIQISINDNGCGIPDELRNKIFWPNFTTKNSGMGLGLAIVKNIIESFDGKIWFESALNVGTTFYITLLKYQNDEDSK